MTAGDVEENPVARMMRNYRFAVFRIDSRRCARLPDLRVLFLPLCPSGQGENCGYMNPNIVLMVGKVR